MAAGARRRPASGLGSARLDNDRLTAAAAQHVACEQRAKIENGEWTPPRSRRAYLSFADLVARFLQGYQTRSGQIDYYESRAKVWVAYFRDRPVSSITPLEVDAFRKARTRIVSPSTVRKDLTTLSTLFRWALGRGFVRHNPAAAELVRRPPESRHRKVYLTRGQEARVVAASPAWLRLVVRWAINTGMDRAEILELCWSDVDEHAGVIHAPRSKTGAPREIPLNETLRSLLGEARRLPVRPRGQSKVFLKDQRPIALEAVKSALKRAYKRADIHVPGPFKVFRHTFASRLAMAGHSAQSIARLLGHTTTVVTDGYMHLSPAHLRHVMATLDHEIPHIEPHIESDDRVNGGQYRTRTCDPLRVKQVL